ncbi:MAG: DNA ligase (NAD(+)) LigA [Desulfobacterales bacterium]|nr:DNA ligase (NAD(+)) LigA [Desulfobacterales bacterium]
MKRIHRSASTRIIIIFLLTFSAAAMAMDREAARERIEALSAEITRHNYLYYVLGRPEISKREYDMLFEELLGLEKAFPDLALTDSPTKRVGSALDDAFPRVKHEAPMLSLEKFYTMKGVASWVKKTRGKAGKNLSFVLEEKIDGVGLELIYKEGRLVMAATRGDGETGFDVTRNARAVKGVPLVLKRPVSLTVRGEVFIKKSDFERINKKEEEPYDSARNLAAGALRRKRAGEKRAGEKRAGETARTPLSIFVFAVVSGDVGEITNHDDLLKFSGELGLPINPNNRTLETIAEIETYIKDAESRMASLDYEFDGVVIKVNDARSAKLLGRTGRHPRWAAAYKFKSPENITVVEDIVIRVGRHGQVTPAAKLRPVKISGVTIRSATLHNQGYIDALALAVGDTVRVSRRGNVIPAVDEVVEKGAAGRPVWQTPARCPGCDAVLERDGKRHFCPNEACPRRLRARLIYFAKKMRIKHLGEKTMDALISEKGVRYPEDLYALSSDDLKGVKGFGDKKAASVKHAIEESRGRPYQTVLLSLGVEGLGPRNIRFLTRAGFDSTDKIRAAGPAGLSSVDGVGRTSAEKILNGFTPRLRKTIDALKREGLTL